MQKITENFCREEFDCHDGTEYPAQWVKKKLVPLCQALEKIRALTGQPMTILSGYRTMGYNAKVQGKPKSQHMNGVASDIYLSGMTPAQLAKAIAQLIENGIIPEGGLGLYKNFVHYDIRGVKARWGLPIPRSNT